MNVKKIVIYLLFLIIGVVLGVFLLFIANITNFTHTNLTPMGGKSWAMWVNPLSLSLGLFFAALYFKIWKPSLVFIVSLLIAFVFFWLVYNGHILDNPIPFGM